TAGAPVLERIMKGTPRPAGNRVASFETPQALADRMRDLAAVTVSDHVLEPRAGRGQLIAKLPRPQQITASKGDPHRPAHLAIMPHCREGAMTVSEANFLDHNGENWQIALRVWSFALRHALISIAPRIADSGATGCSLKRDNLGGFNIWFAVRGRGDEDPGG